MKQIILALTVLVALAVTASWWSLPASGQASGNAARIYVVKSPHGYSDAVFTGYSPPGGDPNLRGMP